MNEFPTAAGGPVGQGLPVDRRFPVDQRLRVLAALAGSVIIALMQSTDGLLLVVGGCALSYLWACAGVTRFFQSPDGKLGARRLLRLNFLTVMVWLTLPWGFTGEGGLAWQPRLAEQAFIITLRLNAIGLWCLLWLSRIEAVTLARGLRALGMPASVALLMFMSLQVLERLGAVRQRLSIAMRARAAPSRLGWRRLQVTAQLLVLLIIESLRAAETLTVAMRARGMNLASGGVWLARGSWLAVPRGDWWGVGVALSLLVSILWSAG